MSVDVTFQSSPAYKGGRFLVQDGLGEGWRRFQSSPAYKGGRFPVAPVRPGAATSFNPRPPIKAGASVCLSKHAAYHICFNPRPPIKAGASLGSAGIPDVASKFQSSPAYKGGRFMCIPVILSRCRACFNPRPPIKAGASHICFRPTSRRASFQSSPAYKGGRFANSPTCGLGWSFSLVCANATRARRYPACAGSFRTRKALLFRRVGSNANLPGFAPPLSVRVQTSSGSSKLIDGLTPKCRQCSLFGSRSR